MFSLANRADFSHKSLSLGISDGGFIFSISYLITGGGPWVDLTAVTCFLPMFLHTESAYTKWLGVCPSNRMTKEVGYNEGNLNRGVVYEQDIPSLRARPAVPDACINAGLATQRSSGLFCLGCGGKLDLSAVTERYAHEERRYPPYHPQLMVKVLLYAYCIGVPSSWKIARKLEEDIAFRVLAANNTPDFCTISDFRKDHLKALAGLFVQVLKLCQKAGLVKLGHVALDGTKIQANASKHKAMSYKRMKEEETRVNNHQH